MKSLTAADRKSLIRLASSLPKGDKSRRAILAGLSKVAAKKVVLEGLDPRTHKEILNAIDKVKRTLKDSNFVAYSDIFKGSLKEASPTLYVEEEQTEYVRPAGFGLIGSILPLLKGSAKREVEEALRSQGISVANTKGALGWAEDGFESGGGWRWEDTSATWVMLWDFVKGKAVDAVAISKLVEKLDNEYDEEDDEDDDW